jgi:hypothetical protein
MEKNKITTFKMEPIMLEKWLKQNGGEYTGDVVEGCLLDSFVVFTKRGIAAFYESYVNSCQSNYYVEFQVYPGNDVFEKWHKFSDKYGYGEI